MSSKSQEQELIPKVRDYWINLILHSGRQVQREEVEEDVEWLYQIVGLAKPKILIFDSYLAYQVAFNILSRNGKIQEDLQLRVGISIYHQVSSEIQRQGGGDLRVEERANVVAGIPSDWVKTAYTPCSTRFRQALQDSLENPVFRQVGAVARPLGNQVANTLQAAFITGGVGSTTMMNASFAWGIGTGEYPHYLQTLEMSLGLGYESLFATFDYFEKRGWCEGAGNRRRYYEFLRKGVWSYLPFKEAVLICRLPIEVSTNTQGRPHSTEKPAIHWADGLDNYFIDGVSFDRMLWNKVAKRTISAKEIAEMSNVEQKTVALRLIGYDSVVAELGGRIIDQLSVKHPSGRTLNYQVIDVELQDDGRGFPFNQARRGISVVMAPARFVKVTCPSTGKETLLRVDPRVEETKTCRGAVAWTFSLREKEYHLGFEA